MVSTFYLLFIIFGLKIRYKAVQENTQDCNNRQNIQNSLLLSWHFLIFLPSHFVHVYHFFDNLDPCLCFLRNLSVLHCYIAISPGNHRHIIWRILWFFKFFGCCGIYSQEFLVLILVSGINPVTLNRGWDIAPKFRVRETYSVLNEHIVIEFPVAILNNTYVSLVILIYQSAVVDQIILKSLNKQLILLFHLFISFSILT